MEVKELTFESFLDEAKNHAMLITNVGGRLFVVGGCVRDWKLGIEKPKDYDLLVTGLEKETFQDLFPKALLVGNESDGFPVFLVPIANMSCEVAFARKEKKVGTGYKGFETYTHPTLTVQDDLVRRDLTINAMAVDVLTGEFVDPYGGMHDLEKGIIRHVSEAFAEDPLRILRAARFAARYGFKIHEQTLAYMGKLKTELATFKPERVYVETEKALAGKKPSLYFRTLAEIGVLDVHYPEVSRLIGVAQPEKYHPEGCAFEHSMLVLDSMANFTDRLELRFAALVHDLGKADSPLLWDSYPKNHPYKTHRGHEEKGVPHVEALCKRLKLPKKWLKAGTFGATYHGHIHRIQEMKKNRVLGELIQIMEASHRNPIGVKGMALLALADVNGKGEAFESYANAEFWEKVANELLQVKADVSIPVSEIAMEKRERQVKVYKAFKKEFFNA